VRTRLPVFVDKATVPDRKIGPTAVSIDVISLANYDDDGIRVLLEELLLDRGYNVVTAPNGAEGLDRIQREPRLSLLITDIRMPGIDGWELARRARKMRADLKVLYITGYPGEQHPGDAPPGPLLRKPWRAGEFYNHIEQLIGSGDARPFDPPA
jgi:CheY-like chemotaxis protein